MKPLYRVAKSGVDRILGAALLLLALPLFLLISLWILLADRQAPFFLQPRVGKEGRLFNCVKFATMQPAAESMLTSWKASNSPLWQEYVANNNKLKADPRITRSGRWLRKTSLDELPQLWNVAKGEMSLVGPRPLLPRELPAYGEAAYAQYIRVSPGITGLWQISGRATTSFAERAQLDAAYVRQASPLFDLLILARTVKVVLRTDGAY